MALKALMLRKKLDGKKKELEDLRAKDADFERREQDLEISIEEAETEEEKDLVDSEVETFEKEKQDHEDGKAGLEREIADLEEELKKIEETQDGTTRGRERKEEKVEKIGNRTKFFGMDHQERDLFFARQDVKEFLDRTRSLAMEKRAVNGAELLIPEVVLDLIRENVEGYSKLYKHVNAKKVPGKARQKIMGAIPEAVWTEMCAKLNELNIDFADAEVDGYKVSGFISICNAVLEDSEINLATEIITTLGQAIGLALDKAILYGTGTKMPLGIVTRLAQETKPADYPTDAREWKDLHTSNILTITGKTDLQLFKAIVEGSGAAKGTYSHGEKFWTMNEKTYTTLVSNAMSINAAGAIVSGQEKKMPIIGGAIETLEFIPDGVIIGGYGNLYLLAERAGATISQSEHARFLEDQTVFKGTARYDGEPVIAEGFVAMGISGTAPTADAVKFAEDKANASA